MLLHAVRDAGVCNRQSEPCVGTNKQNKCGTVSRSRASEQTINNNKNKMRWNAGESEQMLSAGRRDKQNEQVRPHRPGDGGDEQRRRTDPEMAVTSSATNM